jgi:hypothetical protein
LRWRREVPCERRFLDVGLAFGGRVAFDFGMMKTLGWLVTVLLCLGAGGCQGVPGGESDVSGELFGPLALGQEVAKVVDVLGEPKAKGEDRFMAATGEWVQEWEFPARGLTLMMGSGEKGGAKTVWSITADAKCELATARGIRIGSGDAEVRKAYAKEYDAEGSVAGETFVAGSVYGGVIFGFEGGKVVEIFLGAAAE